VINKGDHPANSFDERTRHIISKATVPVGVLIDKGLKKIEKVFIPIFDADDLFLIGFAQRLINNSSAQITILDAEGEIKKRPELKESIRAIEQIAPNHIQLINERAIESEFLKDKDLMLISIESWERSENSKSNWLNGIPSSLILTR